MPNTSSIAYDWALSKMEVPHENRSVSRNHDPDTWECSFLRLYRRPHQANWGFQVRRRAQYVLIEGCDS
jgi:hypothetical protein